MLYIIVAVAYVTVNLFVLALCAASKRGDAMTNQINDKHESDLNEIELYANTQNVA